MQTIRVALEPVLRDVAATTDIGLMVDDGEPHDQHSLTATLSTDDSGGSCISVHAGSSEAEQVCAVAEQVQDIVIEELAARASNWPMCPAHRSSHPMQAELVDGVPRWTCPSDRAVGVAIGALRL